MEPLRRLYSENKLNDVQSLLLAETRPEEELYNLSEDRWEVQNLANEPEHLDKLREMRAILANWIIESDDQGRFPESEAMYDSQMSGYIKNLLKNKGPEFSQELQNNIKLMKQWKAEGK